ncbi:hypothetical protein P3L10_024408 [Capsicum annuum]
MTYDLVKATDLWDDAGVVALIGGGRMVIAGSGKDRLRDAGKGVIVASCCWFVGGGIAGEGGRRCLVVVGIQCGWCSATMTASL